MRKKRLVSIGKISKLLPWITLRNPKAVVKWIELAVFGRKASPYCYNYPFILQIETTNLCNLRCKMCPRERDFQKAGIEPGTMSFDTFDQILRSWIRHIFQIHLFGYGEPLLTPELPKLIEYSKSHGVPYVTFTTNGHLLQGQVAKAIAGSGLDELRVSIDGSDEKGYQSIRGVPLENVNKNLKEFRKISDIPISLATTLCNENWESVYNMPEFAAEIGAGCLRILPIFPYTFLGMDEMILVQEKKRQYRYFCRDLERRCKEKGIHFIFDDYYVKDCKAPFVMAFIDINGNLTPCCKLGTTKVGNVLERNFFEVWNGPKMMQWRKQLLSRKFPKPCLDLECIRDWR